MISDLQDSLHQKEEELTRGYEEEVTSLQQPLEAEKERARRNWKINCKHLAEQDAIITAREEEIVSLKRQITTLQTRVKDSHGTSPLVTHRPRPDVRLSFHEPVAEDISPHPSDTPPFHPGQPWNFTISYTSAST